MKRIIKKGYKYLRDMRRKYKFRNAMKKKIDNAAVKIVPLSVNEKSEIKRYWDRYGVDPDYKSFEWYYSITGIKSSKYIAEDLYDRYVLPCLNDMERCNGINDKNLFDVLFKGTKMPETVFHNINGTFLDNDFEVISKDEAIALARSRAKVVIKPAVDACQGQNVCCIESNDIVDVIEKYKKDYIVQELVVQHSELAKLNESSVNVVRINTLILNNKVFDISPIIRVGAPGNFTDHFNVAIGINGDGSLNEYGVTTKGEHVNTLANGQTIKDICIPSYKEMVEMAIKMHLRIPQARIIGWDITVDHSKAPVLIEANLNFPGIGRSQDCNGPFFGEITDDVFDFIFNK